MSATPAQRIQARAAILHWHRDLRPSRARCGAKRKRDGEPCEQLALANGRCAYHGGRTGSGDKWHKIRWPNGKAPDAEQKLNRKLRDHERAAKKRAKRVAAMTQEERERYEAWLRTHQPGSKAARETRRRERKQAGEIAAALAKKKPHDPAINELQSEIDELKRHAAALEGGIFS